MRVDIGAVSEAVEQPVGTVDGAVQRGHGGDVWALERGCRAKHWVANVRFGSFLGAWEPQLSGGGAPVPHGSPRPDRAIRGLQGRRYDIYRNQCAAMCGLRERQ